MPTRYDSEDDSRESAGGDREISLGTGTVLAIFLALALVCSLFFGLGYSMGRKSAPSTNAAVGTSPALGRGTAEKTSSGSFAASKRPGPDTTDSDLQVVQPMPGTSSARESGAAPAGRFAGSRAGARDRNAAVTEVPLPQPPDASTSAIPGLAGTQSFVQVAAVSRKEDADLLLAALKRRGYAGLIRQQTLDNLLHVQVGPFPTKKDAEAMRQRLITDGYNPIIK